MALITGHSQVKYFNNYVQNSTTKCLFFSGCKVEDLPTLPAVVAAIPAVSVVAVHCGINNLPQHSAEDVMFKFQDLYDGIKALNQSGEHSLWCSRKHGRLEARSGSDLCSAWNPVCIGVVYGVIGKIKIHPEADWKLLLIRQQTLVGKVASEHDVFKIEKVAVLSLSETDPVEWELDLCKRHHFGIRKTDRITQAADGQGKSLQKTWNSLKSAAENVKPKKKEVKDKERFERRILEELIKMYNDSDAFYYSTSYDLTNSIQQQYSRSYDHDQPAWRKADKRFFWNKHMLKELIEQQTDQASVWIQPIIQGSVDIQRCELDFSTGSSDTSPVYPTHHKKKKDPLYYIMILISRRSRYRAGTRSKRRGLDEMGACANYVETEQIIEFGPHRVSFVQVRGSIPVYWSQTGVKYRPPPKLDKGENETYEAFEKHFDEQLKIYKSVAVVTLAELTGKEKAIGDAYLNNVLKYNSPDITYVTFDFHEYCRGMKFENVSLLTDGVKDIIKHMRYCWVDTKGMICAQRGVFRVNCVDCLDRTNVVQTAIARIVLETQCRKLGLLAPDENLPENCRRIYQQLWANTGDAISRQYAGTAALKGDFTRTGERKWSGLMKDGMNSANRYYLRFKDTYRQAAIDLTLGKAVSDEILSGKLKVPEEDLTEIIQKEENVKMLIEDAKKMLISEPEECLGGWSLINADPQTGGEPDRQEMDLILLLSQRAVYVAWYDDDEEQISQYQRIFLEDIEKIEIGAEPTLFKSKVICMRLHYRHYADEGFFHSFRAPSTRLFNNILITVRNQEEAKESLSAICQSFAAAQHLLSLELSVVEKQKLDRKKTLPHPEVYDVHQQLQENALSHIKLPRDISSSDIPSGSSSRGPSPLMGRKLSGTPPLPTSENQLRPERTESQKPRMLSPSSLTKGLLSSLPKVNKNINLNSGFDISVPKINLKPSTLVHKLKTGSAAVKMFTKETATRFSVSYKKQDDVDAVISDTTKQEAPVITELHRTLSRDDSTIDDGIELVEADTKEEVVLNSCGILATNTKQIFESPQYSFDEVETEHIKLLSKSCEEPITGKVQDINKSAEKNITVLKSDDGTDSRQNANTNTQEKSVPGYDSLLRSDISGKDIAATEKNQADVVSEQRNNTDVCPHIEAGPSEIEEPVWHLREPEQPNISKNSDLNLGQKRVIDNSEADKILEKYSKSKQMLDHPSLRISFSDSAISSNNVERNVDQSPKSALDLELEINSALQMQLPNLLQSSRMSRKSHRIYENLKRHLQERLGNKECQSTIIFI